MLYLANSFSLGMLKGLPASVWLEELSAEHVAELLEQYEWESIIGHEGTAKVLERLLGYEIPVNRKAIQLETSDTLVVFQLLQRLPEGKILSREEVEKIPHKFIHLWVRYYY